MGPQTLNLNIVELLCDIVEWEIQSLNMQLTDLQEILDAIMSL